MIKQAARKWDISVGLALIRSPVIAPEMTEVERGYDKTTAIEEHERSLMSDFELRKIKDQELLLKRRKLEDEGKNLSQLDEEIGVSAMQKEQEWAQFQETMQKQYNLGDLSTVQVDDPKSLRSKLDRKLVLLVQQKFDSLTSPWILPQLKNNGETLRQTVERCLGETFSGDVNVSIDGNAPMSHYKHVYPKPISEKTGSHGNMIFIYSACINELDRKLALNNSFINDYSWVSQEQLDLLTSSKNKRYLSKVRMLLFE